MKIKQIEPLSENAICRLIYKDSMRIQLLPDYFWLSDGFFVVKCRYDFYKVLYKLQRLGLIGGYQNFKVTGAKEIGFEKIIYSENEEKAEVTGFYYHLTPLTMLRLVKINDGYFGYQTKYFDVFANCNNFKSKTEHPKCPHLRVYHGDELLGIIMPVRCEELNGIDIVKKGETV